jgi:hypothetical protein
MNGNYSTLLLFSIKREKNRTAVAHLHIFGLVDVQLLHSLAEKGSTLIIGNYFVFSKEK